jgi:hypothetical protein
VEIYCNEKNCTTTRKRDLRRLPSKLLLLVWTENGASNEDVLWWTLRWHIAGLERRKRQTRAPYGRAAGRRRRRLYLWGDIRTGFPALGGPQHGVVLAGMDDELAGADDELEGVLAGLDGELDGCC